MVIGIISLLVSILMPSLGRAREMARSVKCLANLRRLAITGYMYVHENGVFPPVRLNNNPDGSVHVNSYGRSKPRWHWFLNEGVGAPINPHPYGGAVFGDNQTVIMTNDHFMCPSFSGPQERDIRNGAYGYNYQYLGDSRAVSGGRFTNYPVSESRISMPAQTVFLGDSRGGGIPHGGHSYTLDPPKLAVSRGVLKFGPTAPADGPISHSPVSDRHLGRGNVSFVDGHAETMSLNKLGYEIDAQKVVIPNAGSNALWSGTGQTE